MIVYIKDKKRNRFNTECSWCGAEGVPHENSMIDVCPHGCFDPDVKDMLEKIEERKKADEEMKRIVDDLLTELD